MFGSLFDDDFAKLKKGTLSPRDAAGKALTHLRQVPLDPYSRILLGNALLKMATVDLAKALVHYPDIFSFIDSTGPAHHDAYLLIRQVNEQTPDPMLSACSNKLASRFMDAAFHGGTPSKSSPEWHKFWWTILKDEFIERNYESRSCSSCGSDIALAHLELSHPFKSEVGDIAPWDPRTWTLTCTRCGKILATYSGQKGGLSDLIRTQ